MLPQDRQRVGALGTYNHGMSREFMMVLRGYDKKQVDAVVSGAVEALAADGDDGRRAAARDALRTASFTVVLRGYNRFEVDEAVQALLRDLDSTAPRDEFRMTLGSLLRLSQPTDQQILDEVRRLRDLADRDNL